MTQEERNDAIWVKFLQRHLDDREDTYICSYYTTAIDQVLKMYITAKENNIKCYFNKYSDIVPREMANIEHFIVDVNLALGNESDANTIEVILQ